MKTGIDRLWKFSFRIAVCIILLMSFKFVKEDYSQLFSIVALNPVSYDEIYLMHFDFCSPISMCNDTAEVEAFFTNRKKRVALIVDTLYNNQIPEYIKLNQSDIYYVDRIWLQRRGFYSEYQQKLIISKKGKFKKRILLK